MKRISYFAKVYIVVRISYLVKNRQAVWTNHVRDKETAASPLGGVHKRKLGAHKTLPAHQLAGAHRHGALYSSHRAPHYSSRRGPSRWPILIDRETKPAPLKRCVRVAGIMRPVLTDLDFPQRQDQPLFHMGRRRFQLQLDDLVRTIDNFRIQIFLVHEIHRHPLFLVDPGLDQSGFFQGCPSWYDLSPGGRARRNIAIARVPWASTAYRE